MLKHNTNLLLKLEKQLLLDDISEIKSNIKIIAIEENHSIDNFIENEFNQILNTQTLERTKYYINRLIKALSVVRTGRINDINLNRWKEYDDIITDSLWILEKRDNSGAHNADYWGNFVPQIPNQLIRRYTKKNEWVLDTFLGSGTTLIECKRLHRNGIGIELQPQIIDLAKQNITNDSNIFNLNSSDNNQIHIFNSDAVTFDYKNNLEREGINSVQLVILHPPYWDIIKFSKDQRDLSNATTIQDFLFKIGKIVEKVTEVLDKDRYLAIIIGDKYSGSEWIPLGFYTMQEVLKYGYVLKSIIVKNYEETKAKLNQKELWRYRALVGGFYIFKHEYIYLFSKK